jgi:hypothetical protein
VSDEMVMFTLATKHHSRLTFVGARTGAATGGATGGDEQPHVTKASE